MDRLRTQRLALTLCATALFGSDVGAYPIDGPTTRPVPICAAGGLSPRSVGAVRPPLPPCLDGSRWYGPYGYICYRTRGPRQVLGAYAGPR